MYLDNLIIISYQPLFFLNACPITVCVIRCHSSHHSFVSHTTHTHTLPPSPPPLLPPIHRLVFNNKCISSRNCPCPYPLSNLSLSSLHNRFSHPIPCRYHYPITRCRSSLIYIQTNRYSGDTLVS